MEEQPISFETAELAKQKEFDIATVNYYEDMDQKLHAYRSIKKNWNKRGPRYSVMYSAPNQSLLQKWLREDHKVHLTVFETEKMNKGLVYVYRIRCYFNNRPEYLKEHIDTKTYEEALESGLKHALQLI